MKVSKTGMWLETVSNGKKSEMLIRAGEPYTELTSEPKAIEKQAPPISHIMASQKGKIFKIASKILSVVEVEQKRLKIQDGDQTFHVAIDDEDAPKLLPLILFVKTFDWKRYAIPIRTEEAGVPYWFGKAIGKPKRAPRGMCPSREAISRRDGGSSLSSGTSR